MGKKVVAIRHPMPYGDLEKQVCQRFASYEDLDFHKCTIEEREEYEPHIDNGIIVYAGVDYEKILREAEKEADVIVWDGGNNDFPFYVSDLHIVLVDPHRPGHELKYHPGEMNLRMADIVIINKIDTDTYKKYTHLSTILPAMGYGEKQMQELEETINRIDCEVVVSGTPIDLTRFFS